MLGALVLYSDKTTSKSISQLPYYPVYMTLANFDADAFESDETKVTVGYIPVLQEPDGLGKGGLDYDWSTVNTSMVMAVWDGIIDSLDRAKEKEPIEIPLVSGQTLKVCPRWLYFVGDYPELQLVCGCMGATANRPCRVCLVHKNGSGDLSKFLPVVGDGEGGQEGDEGGEEVAQEGEDENQRREGFRPDGLLPASVTLYEDAGGDDEDGDTSDEDMGTVRGGDSSEEEEDEEEDEEEEEDELFEGEEDLGDGYEAQRDSQYKKLVGRLRTVRATLRAGIDENGRPLTDNKIKKQLAEVGITGLEDPAFYRLVFEGDQVSHCAHEVEGAGSLNTSIRLSLLQGAGIHGRSPADWLHWVLGGPVISVHKGLCKLFAFIHDQSLKGIRGKRGRHLRAKLRQISKELNLRFASLSSHTCFESGRLKRVYDMPNILTVSKLTTQDYGALLRCWR